MNEETNKLIENVMSALGDNPAETLSQMLSSLTDKTDNSDESPKETGESAPQNDLGIDPSMLLAIQGLLNQSNNHEKDDRSALLSALKPFMSEDRRPQIDRAIKLLHLSKLAKTAQELNLFKELL